MNPLTSFLLLLLLQFPLLLEAQEITLIRNSELSFKNAEDYDDFEDNILLCIDWLATHSLNDKDRINTTAVFLTWIKGTSTHTVYYEDYVLPYTRKNPEFFVLFLSGWVKYLIKNKGQKISDYEGNLAGVNMFLDFYEKGEAYGVIKDKKIEKLLKKRVDNKLEKFIAVQIRR